MKRKSEQSNPSKIYTFGVLGQFLDRDMISKINNALYQKHKHMCELIQTERERRNKYRKARAGLFPIMGIYDAATPEERKSLKKERDTAAKQAKDNEELKNISRAGFAEQREKIRELRKTIFWGHYLLNEKAFESVVKKTGSDPIFKRFDGNGRIGVQVQTTSHKHIFANNDAGTLKIGSEKIYKRAVMVRIQCDNGRTSKNWITLPVIFHRPLPPDATITWAWLKVEKHANKTRYDLQLVINSATFKTRDVQPASPKAVALDIGWRSFRDANNDQTIRYAMLYDGKDFIEKRLCPDKIRYPDTIRSIRDQVCLSIRKIVWSVRDTLPTETREHMQYMADPGAKKPRRGAWQSPKGTFKLYKLMREFGQNHPLTDWLDAWQRRDIHLWQWEASQRRRSLANRRDQYRCLLSELSKKYDYLIIEDFKTGEVIRKTGEPRKPNLQRITIAPYEFFSLCPEYFPKNRLIKVNPINTTRECNFCHHINMAKKSLMLVCENCSEEYDCDTNASANIYEIGFPEVAAAAE